MKLGDTDYLPLHYSIHDAQGNSAVLEWVKGELQIYYNIINENKIDIEIEKAGPYMGVMTNSPTYDWHIANQGNYVQLSNHYNGKLDKDDYPDKKPPFFIPEHGIGLLGLPGDPTPPSRFVQTWTVNRIATAPEDSQAALVFGQKLMNRVDRPLGLIYDDPYEKASDEVPVKMIGGEITQWVVFRDHTNQKYYYRTYNDMTLKVLDLNCFTFGKFVKELDIATKNPTVIPVDESEFR